MKCRCCTTSTWPSLRPRLRSWRRRRRESSGFRVSWDWEEGWYTLKFNRIKACRTKKTDCEIARRRESSESGVSWGWLLNLKSWNLWKVMWKKMSIGFHRSDQRVTEFDNSMVASLCDNNMKEEGAESQVDLGFRRVGKRSGSLGNTIESWVLWETIR